MDTIIFLNVKLIEMLKIFVVEEETIPVAVEF